MQDSKIIRLLKSLDSRELRLLYKYFRSPFFNYSPAMITLYEYLRKYYPAFDAYQLDRKRVFAKVYPGEAFQDKKMRNLSHEFLVHVENFLVQMHLREDGFLRKKILMESLGRRNQYDAFVRENQELIAEVENRSYRDIQTFYNLLSLHKAYYFHASTNKLKEGEEALQAMLENLDNYFMSDKLRLANEAAAREKVVQQKVPIDFVEEVLSKLDQGKSEERLLLFYSLLYRLNEDGKESQFFELKIKFFAQSTYLSFSDQQTLLFQLLNYAIRNGNKGDQSFLKEAFDLYWFGLQEKLLFDNGKLTDSTFTNIVFGGCKIGALEKVEFFIKEYAQYLEEYIREDAEILALSFLYYKKQEHEKVDELIGNAQFRSTFYQLRTRAILIRSLFELTMSDDSFFDTLLSRMEAFEKYLRRSAEISSLQRNAYLGFLRFLRAILKYRTRSTSLTERGNLRKKIQESKEVTNKDWLLEQF